MVYLPDDGHPSTCCLGQTLINSMIETNTLTIMPFCQMVLWAGHNAEMHTIAFSCGSVNLWGYAKLLFIFPLLPFPFFPPLFSFLSSLPFLSPPFSLLLPCHGAAPSFSYEVWWKRIQLNLAPTGHGSASDSSVPCVGGDKLFVCDFRQRRLHHRW